MKVLRAGFKQKLNPTVSKFVSSAKDDEALIDADIQGSLAHAKMLRSCGLIDDTTLENLIHGLKQVQKFYQDNGYKLDEELEDVHMNVEEKLKEFIGSHSDYLHTARSRNDQVALDLRLFVLQQAKVLNEVIDELKKQIVYCAEKNKDAVMTGYTHLQRAQPILLSHSMLAFYEMLKRDQDRLDDVLKRTMVSPLGGGALAGTSLPIDVNFTQKELGFNQVFANSLDAISDRDFVMDILYACTTIGVHLSQMAESLIIWMTKEFNFVKLPDSLTTASSLMPQKKNPDALELVRSKCGMTIGELVNVVTILKGLPQGYNRDLQDTKPGIRRVTETIKQAIEVMTLTFENLEVNEASLKEAVSDSNLYATDLLEVLVKKGVPFRQAHGMVSGLAKQTDNLSGYKLEEFQKVCDLFDESVYDCFEAEKSVTDKVSGGSTGIAQVHKALEAAKT